MHVFRYACIHAKVYVSYRYTLANTLASIPIHECICAYKLNIMFFEHRYRYVHMSNPKSIHISLIHTFVRVHGSCATCVALCIHSSSADAASSTLAILCYGFVLMHPLPQQLHHPRRKTSYPQHVSNKDMCLKCPLFIYIYIYCDRPMRCNSHHKQKHKKKHPGNVEILYIT